LGEFFQIAIGAMRDIAADVGLGKRH
jgi:hypothetical protein